MMKLHLCCGTVYLDGYVNVDIQGYVVTPDQVHAKTTKDRYYVHPLRERPLARRGHFPVDMKVDLLIPWPWRDNSADEILIVQALEHFLPDEAEFIMEEIYRVLKIGGEFAFDVPDIVATAIKYQDNWQMLNRLIYCNHKDAYSVHRTAYNEEYIKKFLANSSRVWSAVEFRNIVKHDYPVIGVKAIK